MKYFIVVFMLVLIITPTYAITPDEQIELVKNYAMSIGLGGIGAGTIGTIAYGLLNKTYKAVKDKVAEAQAQTAIAKQNTIDITAKLQASELKQVEMISEFGSMKNSFESATIGMNNLVAEYKARDAKLAEILHETE